MKYHVDAIYEDGLFRPLAALDLPNHEHVCLTVESSPRLELEGQSADPLLGLMSDDAEVVDAVVEDAMMARQVHPLRVSD